MHVANMTRNAIFAKMRGIRVVYDALGNQGSRIEEDATMQYKFKHGHRDGAIQIYEEAQEGVSDRESYIFLYGCPTFRFDIDIGISIYLSYLSLLTGPDPDQTPWGLEVPHRTVTVPYSIRYLV